MSGRRFGGRFSPGGPADPALPPAAAPERFAGRPARQVHAGARLLYLASLPMLYAAIGEIRRGDAPGTLAELGSFVLLVLGAVLVNEGLRAEEAYAARKVAKPPAIPRKLFGAAATGLGITLGAAFGGGLGLLPGIVFGAVGAAATLAAFGFDPMARKGMEGLAGLDGRRAAEAIDRAEATLSGMTEAARRFGDRALEARVERFGAAAREVFRAVEEDPRDLERARKFLGVYLAGARDATVKFADLYARTRDSAARTDYEALLTDLETNFARHRQDLLAADKGALDVEIEVLRKRLREEGIA